MPLVDDVQKFVDGHIREIKYFIYGLGAAGVILIIRDLRLGQTFHRVSDIPSKFVTSHVTLQGKVQQIEHKGLLLVSHEPVFIIPFSRWIQKFSAQSKLDMLPVQLAGVQLTEPGRKWLEQNVLHKQVWFQLLFKTEESMACSVSMKKNLLFQTNINESLVRQGLCTVLLEDFTDSPDKVVQRVIKNLITAEDKARKHKQGLWKPAPHQSKKTSLVWTWLVKGIKRTGRKMKQYWQT